MSLFDLKNVLELRSCLDSTSQYAYFRGHLPLADHAGHRAFVLIPTAVLRNFTGLLKHDPRHCCITVTVSISRPSKHVQAHGNGMHSVAESLSEASLRLHERHIEGNGHTCKGFRCAEQDL
jgi:hypothetical protein